MENGVTLPGNYSQASGILPKEILSSDPLWDSLKAGNYSAFEKIFKLNYPSLFNYGLRFNQDEDEVKDCIQILFLNIWERKEFLGSSDSIRNYLMASLRRLILKRLKSNSIFVELGAENPEFHIELSAESQMIYDQTLTENNNLLQDAIQNLPDRQKEALYLKFYNDRSFADIAAIMNISTRAVYKLIYKALDSLNEELVLQSDKASFLIGSFILFLQAAFFNILSKSTFLENLQTFAEDLTI
ncbi:RNA polymerase sigma factor [Dyadobacter psychrotolerans]|nr:sigma-70 family RNA polymerase sigma factor [Dyadobacter psychrotolerans]